MDLDELEAAISLLVTQMENQPEDRHEFYLQIREKLNEVRAIDTPLQTSLTTNQKVAQLYGGRTAVPSSVVPRRDGLARA